MLMCRIDHSIKSQWLVCGCGVSERTVVRISPWTVVFITAATAVCSLGNKLHTYCSI